jgi:outer membrane cobalamin receptor
MHFAKTPIALAAIAAATLPSLASPRRETELPAITVTSTRRECRLDDVPNTVTVKSARDVEKSGARDIINKSHRHSGNASSAL